MRIIVKFFSVFTISVTLLTPSLLFAQSPISQTPIPLIGGSYAPPAQVDVVNVVLEKQQYNDGDTIRGSFALRNERAESVPAIYYKIILGGDFDAQGNAETIYEVKTFTPYFLRPGEFKTIQFEYTPPIGVTGKHLGIIINAFLEQGTPVSWSFPIFLNVAGDFSYINASDTKIVVNKKEFSTEEGPALYKNQVVEYHVTLQNPSSKQITITPKIDIYKRVALPPTLKSYNEKQITLAPKEKKQIVFELPDFDYKAGVYAGTILLINKEGKQQGPLLTFRYLVLGDTLTIENVTPSHTSVTKGASFSIRVDYSTPLIDFATSQTVDLGTPILEIQAYNERDSLVAEGKSTINPTKIERNKIFQLKASDDAKALRIEAKILKDDVIIAKYSTNLSSDYAIQKERKDLSYQGTLRAWVYGVIVILLLLAATGLFLLKRKKGGTDIWIFPIKEYLYLQ
ncbi:hypothetical protein HZB96_03965 [Candidatus Gottesmanbacteria bacterium]|nr:hypothetical protein [Candidatus Gottesmanbacteria bacterium]